MRAAMREEFELLRRGEAKVDGDGDGKGEGEKVVGEGSMNQWADRRKNREQFGYDADEEAERWGKGREREIVMRTCRGVRRGRRVTLRCLSFRERERGRGYLKGPREAPWEIFEEDVQVLEAFDVEHVRL